MTGDLAYQKIFPSLQAMLKRGHIEVPIIGVAKAGWKLDQMKARAKDSLERHGGVDPNAFARLVGLLRYVDGDYNEPATFAAIKRELGGAKRPAHYLAIPPLLFGKVVEQLGGPGCSKDARVIVEKPFGTDLASAQELNHRRVRISPAVQFAFGMLVMADDEKMIGALKELQGTPLPINDEKDAHERVLTDAIEGDARLFARQDYVEEAWRIVAPVLKAGTPVHDSAPGTWGPAEAGGRFALPGGWSDPIVPTLETVAGSR